MRRQLLSVLFSTAYLSACTVGVSDDPADTTPVTGGTSGGGSSGTGALGGNGGDPTSGGSGGMATGGAAPAGGSGGMATGGAAPAGGSGGMATGGAATSVRGLSWPIDCVPQETCLGLGYPDIDGDGLAFDCGDPGYVGHEGTDISISWEQMDAGVSVRAAADGEVFFAADGKYDRCPDDTQPDCQRPPDYLPGDSTGTNVCTELGPYCGSGGGSCYWCFAGGNVVVILHDSATGVFATRYDHLRRGSVLVSPGDRVVRGQQIAQVGSAGNSTGPHLHFEVWSTGYYELTEPWAGECGPNTGSALWVSEPPWG